MSESPTFQAGFQGSETSGAEIFIYPQGNDPILNQVPSRIAFEGRTDADKAPSLTRVTTTKRLGQAAGTFALEIKPPRFNESEEDLRKQILDDDWVDIVFTRHARRFHTMRGLIETFNTIRKVGGSGATEKTYKLTGSDHGSIWEKTPIWYNRYAGENAAGAASIQVTQAPQLLAPVNDVVSAILFGFIEDLSNRGRAIWKLPTEMPNGGGNTFGKVVAYYEEDFTNDPARIAINQALMDPNGAGAWNVAQEWSDPMFVEMFTDLWGVGQNPILDQQALDVTDTEMVLVLRDRPLVNSEQGIDSPWFFLPTFIVPQQELISVETARNGQERYNGFFVSPQITQEIGSSHLDVTKPLLMQSNVKLHGLRRMDVMSRYKAVDADLISMTETQRKLVRDWHLINPYLYSGTISLAIGRPDIRVGSRVRIPGASVDQDETYYVESVTHDWQFGQGTRTTLGVTRGWIGDDQSLVDALNRIVAESAELPLATAGGSLTTPPGDEGLA